MSVCSVLGCDSKRRRKNSDVSFHQFPKDEETIKKWSAATGRKNWKPNRLSRICSIHFEEDCFHRCKSISFIKKFAIPTLFLYDPSQNESSVSVNNMNNDDDHLNMSSSVETKRYDRLNEDIIAYPGNRYVVLTSRAADKPESIEVGIKLESNTDKPTNLEIPYPGNRYVVLTTKPAEKQESIEVGNKIKHNGVTNLEVCRLCLAVECRMFQLNDKLKQAFSQVTGILVSSDDGLPQWLCWECASRVLSALKLSDRAAKAHNILSSLLALSGSINMQDIRSIDRRHMKLMTSLTCEIFKDTQYHNMIDIIEVEKSYNSDDDSEIDENTFRNESEDNDDHENVDNNDDVDEDYDNDKYENDVDEDYNNDKYDNEVDEDDENDNYENEVDQHDNDEEIDINDPEIENDSTMEDVESLNGHQKQRTISKIERVFTVTAVNIEDAIIAVKRRKQSQAYIDAPFKCEVCYRGYFLEKHYERHAMKHTEVFGSLECVVCKFRYKEKRLLSVHMSRLHRSKYSCKQCEFVTCSRTMATNHLEVHGGQLLKCPHCPKLLNHKTSYYSHIRIKHACDFACELCGHTFLSAFGLTRHKVKQHTLDDLSIDGPFCETCDIRFATHDAYDTHLQMSSRHNNDNQLSKVNVYRNTTLPGTRKVNARGPRQRKKLTKRPVTCEKCGLTLESAFSYAHHFRAAHPNETRTQYFKWKGPPPAVCDQCGKTFRCLALLKYHMPVHTGERFECDDCGKTFKGKQNLYIHRKIHEPSRQTFPCELCGKLFHFSANLRRHILIHANATPYECEECGKRVSTRASLQAHIAHVHSGRPWPKRVRLRRRPTDTKTTQPPKTQTID